MNGKQEKKDPRRFRLGQRRRGEEERAPVGAIETDCPEDRTPWSPEEAPSEAEMTTSASREELLEEIHRLREEAAARDAAHREEKAAWETQCRLSRLSEALRKADLPEELLPLVDHEDPAQTETRLAMLRGAVDRAARQNLRALVARGTPEGDRIRGLTREELRALPLAELEARMGR